MKYLLLYAVFMLATGTSYAQTSKAKPKAKQQGTKIVPTTSSALKKIVVDSLAWSADERKSFLNTCIGALPWTKDSSSAYCTCMLQKIEKLYPTPTEAEVMTQQQAVELAKECLVANKTTKGWAIAERSQFITECEGRASVSAGKTKAKTYCACMLQKIEKEYPNPLDVNNMKQEQVERWAEECMQ